MRTILFIFSILAAFAGAGFFLAAKSAVHETEGFVLFGVAATLFAGAAIIDALVEVKKAIRSAGAKAEELNAALVAEVSALRQTVIQDDPPGVLLPPVQEVDEFFIAFPYGTEGPVSRTKLAELLARESINRQTQVVARGATKWTTVAQVLGEQ